MVAGASFYSYPTRTDEKNSYMISLSRSTFLVLEDFILALTAVIQGFLSQDIKGLDLQLLMDGGTQLGPASPNGASMDERTTALPRQQAIRDLDGALEKFDHLQEIDLGSGPGKLEPTGPAGEGQDELPASQIRHNPVRKRFGDQHLIPDDCGWYPGPWWVFGQGQDDPDGVIGLAVDQGHWNRVNIEFQSKRLLIL